MDNAEAATILAIEIHIARAIAHRRTDNVHDLVPHVLASPEESCRQGIRLRHRLDMHGSGRTAIAVGAPACAGLDALKHRLEAPIVPSLTACIGPMIEVGRMAPHPYHRIDAARSADDLSSRPVDDAPGGAWLPRGAIGPIDIGSKIGWPQHRALQRRPADVIATRLDQQDATGGIFGETR